MRTQVGAQEPDDGEPEEIALWLSTGFRADDAAVWRQWRFSVAQAQAWERVGVDDGLRAAQWSTAGVAPETVDGWRDAGIEASEAVRWHEFGFPLEVARTEKRNGVAPEQAFARSHPTRTTASMQAVGTFPLSARLRGGGRLRRFHESGVDPRLMQGYMQHQWFDDQALAWATQGIEALDAYTWHELGLTPIEAGRLALQGRMPGDVIHEWWSAGVPFEEFADWIGAGLSADEAVEQRSKGITAEQAAALRALRQEEVPVKRTGSSGFAVLGRLGPPGSERNGPPPRDEEAARAEIVEAFAGMLVRDERSNAILSVDGGANLGDCLAEAGQRNGIMPGSMPAVTVDLIRFVNDREARVSFSVAVTGGRNIHLPGRVGRAILVDGAWKVARDTFCDFIQIAGVECPPREG